MSDPRTDDEEPVQPPMVIQPEPEEDDDGRDEDGDESGGNDYGFGVTNKGEVPGEGEPYDSRHFHIVTHKLLINTVFEALSDAKIEWDLIEPFVESARELAVADFNAADIRLHTVRAEGDQWVEAEEAYLGISVADRDSGVEWLSETRWLSDLAIADEDPDEVRRVIAALERSIQKMRDWLVEKEAGGAARTPPAES